MTLQEARQRARNPGAFSPGDCWLIVSATGEPLESHRLQGTAEHFCDVVNQHERKCGRDAGYRVERVTPPGEVQR